MVCPAWVKCREGLDRANNLDLVVFFRKVLDERAKLDAVRVLVNMFDMFIDILP